MARRICLTLGILSLAAFTAQAQQGNIAGPVAGFTFDSAGRVLRPIQGIPGASLLGDPIDLGMDSISAVVSPRLDSALAVAADQSVHAFLLRSGAATPVTLNGVLTAPERIVFSPSGSAAALYGNGRVQTITGFPASPAISGAFDFTPGGGGGHAGSDARAHRPFTGSMAVSDDGTLVLIADGGSVQLYQSGAERPVATARNALVAFAPGGSDAALVDPGGAGVIWLRNLAGSSTRQVLGASNSASGVAFSADGKTLYVANASVTAYDLTGGPVSSVTCDCTPTGLTPMGAFFRLNEVGQGPLWILDPTGAKPRIVFVPARTD